MYYDLETKKYLQRNESRVLGFLYKTIIGRCILKIVTTKIVANSYAKYMNSYLSKFKIKRFIKKNHIDMSIYKKKQYKSFNDFFIRRINEGSRPIESGLIAVCDSKLSIYEIDNDLKLKIKNSIYSIKELIQDDMQFKYALVFRLGVDNYHHYIFPDKGRVLSSKHINGILHTVQPIAFDNYKVFIENAREVTFLQCDKLGLVGYIEVGAMMVGKIVNEKVKCFNKGDEKGHFEFGGSTVIMLLQKNIKLNSTIIKNTKKGIETIVKMGQNIELNHK